jgi:ketosteroid isomerase-like protein
MKRYVISICVLTAALTFTALRAQTGGSVEAEVKQAEDAWVKAAVGNDQAALGTLLAPKLVYTHSTGLIESKQEYMKAVDSFQKYKAITFQNMRINVYGNAAIVNTKARMVGTTRGTPFDNELLLIHVWIKQGGKWQLAAHQTTRLTS